MAIAMVAAGYSVAGNYATCLLDKLPGIQNDSAAMGVRDICDKKYPDGFRGIKEGSGRGWFSYESGAACVVKLASKTPSQYAGHLIYYACRTLYDEPQANDLFSDK